ncbi:hypothetical protein [Falsiroseomonas selenitidurans]|uniref:Uncharacterized protein n=1 Tax=Falsiroseomonas selenitidurans TaxID=2716335 RepID=A0ABX1E8L4_9PROT|nr:hypothetical protein [Falsiroseomonas selenitidurans]NKC33386.1 hypothetical protein [Falsiroseomonas selenitidurans]
MESPTPGNNTGTRGGVSAWQHDPRLFSVPRLPNPLLPAFTAGRLRALLTAAADARRHGDHGAADLLEHDALLAVRVTARQQPWGAMA